MRGLSPVEASRGHSSSRCASLSLLRPLLWSTGSRRAGSVVVAHRPSCSAACGIFPDQGSNPCPLHWQADSQQLRHQGSPKYYFFCSENICYLPSQQLSCTRYCLAKYCYHAVLKLPELMYLVLDDHYLTGFITGEESMFNIRKSIFN